MLKRAIIFAAVLVLSAALPALAQQTTAPPQTGAPAAKAPGKAVTLPEFSVREGHPRLLLSPNDLPRLRHMAQARALRWRRLLSWALEPARSGAVPYDGPGLALAALVVSELDEGLGTRLGKLAVACALKGARFGVVQTYTRDTLLSKTGNRDPLSLLGKGYKILRPSFTDRTFLPVARYTASEITVNMEGTSNLGKASAGDTYLLLQDELLPASVLVQQMALTLDWAWPWFTQEQRQGVARWLISQVEYFGDKGGGAFDTESAAMLSMCTLSALVSHGLEPSAQKLLDQAWRERFTARIRPCLENLGAGGGWFEGDTPGARAGLDLVIFALAMRYGTGVRDLDQVRWYRDRMAYLLFQTLPGVAKAPTGNYRPVAPGGDEVMDQVQAGELVRMQMMGLLSLRPGDPSAGAVRALLLDGRTPTLLSHHRMLYDFLWLDPTAPTEALATVALSHQAPAVGKAVLRSDWSDRATWLGFSCGPHFAMHQHLNAGSLILFRQGMLLPQGGGFDGTTTSHALDYGIRSVAHNTLLVYDPQEYSWYNMRAGNKAKGTYSNDGGQRAWALFNNRGQLSNSAPWTASGFQSGSAPWDKLRSIYQVAGIEALEDKPRYAYLRGRATAAYDGSTHKLKRFVRHVFLLRGNGPDDAEAVEAVAVADDVELTRKGLSVHFVLHFPDRPQPANALKKLGSGRWRGPATPLTLETKESRLDVVPVWPKDAPFGHHRRQGPGRLLGAEPQLPTPPPHRKPGPLAGGVCAGGRGPHQPAHAAPAAARRQEGDRAALRHRPERRRQPDHRPGHQGPLLAPGAGGAPGRAGGRASHQLQVPSGQKPPPGGRPVSGRQLHREGGFPEGKHLSRAGPEELVRGPFGLPGGAGHQPAEQGQGRGPGGAQGHPDHALEGAQSLNELNHTPRSL